MGVTDELRDVLEARTRDHEPDWLLAEAIIQRVPRRRRRRRIAAGASVALATFATVGIISLRPQRNSADLAAASGSAAPSVTPSRDPVEQPTALPGGDAVARLGTPTSKDGVGTQLVRLGPRPSGATHIDIEFSCLTAGTFKFADGAGMSCTANDVHVDGQPAMTLYKLSLAPGQDSTTIVADEDAGWRLLAAYARVERIPWGVNARGETYGVENDDGTPDLVGVSATNGRSGYVYARMLEPKNRPTSPAEAATMVPESRAPIPVYESDGRTVVGEFALGK